MTSILAKLSHGPRSCEAVEVIVGGQLVEARAGGVDLPAVGVAADSSAKVVGVAQADANPDGGSERAPVAGVLDQTLAAREVSVFVCEWVPVVFAAACAYGERVVSAGDGKVRPYDSAGGDTADLIVGFCGEKDGVALDATGYIKLTL